MQTNWAGLLPPLAPIKKRRAKVSLCTGPSLISPVEDHAAIGTWQSRVGAAIRQSKVHIGEQLTKHSRQTIVAKHGGNASSIRDISLLTY